MADRHKLYVLYVIFFVFFAGLLLYGIYIEQYVVPVVSGVALLYLAKEMSRDLYRIDDQGRLLNEMSEDVKLMEKNQKDVENDTYPHVPFFFVHKPDHVFYQRRLSPKINRKSPRELVKKFAALSRHAEKMNDNISYLRKNINHKYLVNSEMTSQELLDEISRLEHTTKMIRYDDSVFIGITRHLIRLHKALILKHRHKNLMEDNKALADLLKETRNELSRFLPQDVENAVS